MSERNYCVYEHVNKVNGKKYIGMTNNPKRRWRNEGAEYYNSPHFWCAIEKYSWGNFKSNIIADNLAFNEACDLEIELIAKYKTQDGDYGYNISPGGNGGRVYTEHPRGMLGKVQSDYQIGVVTEMMNDPERNPMLNGMTIWDVTDPHPRGMLGKKHSEETKRKISDYYKTHRHPCKKQVVMVCPDGTDYIFDSLKEAKNILGTTVIAKLVRNNKIYTVPSKLTNNLENLRRIEGCYFYYLNEEGEED